MKKIGILAFVGIFGLCLSAHAEDRGYGLGGCGVGGLIFKDDPATTSQVLAVTTNGTFTQSFAVSSGTSACVESDDMVMTQLEKIQYYVGANEAIIQKEAARGSGETLTGLSQILGCPANDFSRMMKTDYSQIFGNANTADNIMKAVKADQALAKVCS